MSNKDFILLYLCIFLQTCYSVGYDRLILNHAHSPSLPPSSFSPVDSPPVKKPKVEPSRSPAKNPELHQPNPSNPSNPPSTHNTCYSSHPHINNNSSTNSRPPSLTPSSNLTAQQQQQQQVKSQVTPNTLHNSLPQKNAGSIQQVSDSLVTNTAATHPLPNKDIIGSSGRVTNHQVVQYGTGTVSDSTGFVGAGMAQQSMQTDGQQQQSHHSNNDVSVYTEQ